MAEETLTLHLTITADQGAPRVPLKIPKVIIVTELRNKVSETTKIPKSSLKLIFRGRLIADDDSKNAVSEFKLEEGSVLHCMGRPINLAKTAPKTTGIDTESSMPVVAGGRPPVPSVATARPSMEAPPAARVPTDPLTDSLQTLRLSASLNDYEMAVTTLGKILSNIVNNPMEDKYRRVKKQNPSFQRRLGGRSGGDAALKACGFSMTVENGEEVYIMQADADAWPKLTAAKTTVEAAVRDAKTATNQAAALPAPETGITPGLLPSEIPGMGSPGMRTAVQNLMSNPAALQDMLQNPMLQNMMRSDPRFANNPMMQQAMEQLATNPDMANQLSQMLNDPTMQRQLEAMMQQQGNAASGAGFGLQGSQSGQQAGAHSQLSQGPVNAHPNDEEMTEEDMIAEAIRRSLQE